MKSFKTSPKTKHIFWDHLPFWFVVAATLAFAGLDVWAQLNQRGIYAPEQETGQ